MKEQLDTYKKRYDTVHNAYWTDVLNDQALADWHQQQLRDVVDHVKCHSPFYARRLAHIDASRLTLADLTALPFTTKEDLREAGFAILSGPLEDAIFYYETTGTTGPATPCPRDRKESYASNRQLAMAYQAVVQKHFPGHKTVIGIMGPTEVHSFGDTLGDVCAQLDFCNAKLWPHSPVIGWPKALQLLKDLHIGVLASAPGLLLAMAKEAERQGFNPKQDFSLRAFMMSGELCTPALKNNLFSLWGAQAYNSLYGSQEAMIIAACNADDQLMPHRLNYLIEVLDPLTGHSQGATGEGELCVTLLIPGTKPLIRYRTGDLVSIQSRPGYPQSMRHVIKVVGRVKDAVQLNDRAFSAAQIEQALLEGVELCLGYQIVLSRANGRDTVIAKLEMSKFFEGDQARLVLVIKERLRERLGVDATVMVVDDLAEHVNLGSWFSWKEARIVDQRKRG
nr:AMP-binding protein [uncultured Pseudomonas sp.]